MKFPGKNPRGIWALGTAFYAFAFLACQILVAIAYLNLQNPTPGNLVLIMAAAYAVFLVLVVGLTMFRKRGRDAEANESGNFVSTVHREAYKEVLEALRKNYLSRLNSIDGEKFHAPAIALLQALSRKMEESLTGNDDPGGNTGIDEESLLQLIRGLVQTGSECAGGIQDADSERTAMKVSMASMNTTIDASLPIIEKVILATEEYEAEIASKIFEKFEEIWEYSKTLVGDSERTLHLFSKGGKEEGEGLAYIAARNKEISSLFKDFTEVVERLEKNAHSFLESSIKGLEEIRKTIGGIEDMAERIKIISINVRIEAARESGRNNGFNVLGQEITSFAEQTSVFSGRTVSEIEETIGNLKPLRDELLGNLNLVQAGMDSVAEKMAPYNKIIDQGFVQMDSVTKNLNEISINILNKMKQTIGDLQYQDITNQEAMHIIEILERMKDRCANYSDVHAEGWENDAERDRQIRSDVFQTVKSIITTGTEIEILNGFLAEHGMKPDDGDQHILDGTTNLDDKTILF